MSLAFSECKKCKRNKIGYICSWEDKFNYNCKNFTPKENKKIVDGKMGDKGSYICDILDMMEIELNIN